MLGLLLDMHGEVTCQPRQTCVDSGYIYFFAFRHNVTAAALLTDSVYCTAFYNGARLLLGIRTPNPLFLL